METKQNREWVALQYRGDELIHFTAGIYAVDKDGAQAVLRDLARRGGFKAPALIVTKESFDRCIKTTAPSDYEELPEPE